MKIIPGILTKDPEIFHKQIAIARQLADWVQIDVADNKFVNNETLALADIPAGSFAGLASEIHLMVTDPLAYLADCRRLDVDRIIFHFEAVAEPKQVIEKIKELNFQAALALNPDTPVSASENWLSLVNSVLLMSVQPGQQGQNFLPDILAKIAQVRLAHPSLMIGVDGGINERNIEMIADYQPDYVVIGSGLWQSEDVFRTLQHWREKLKNLE